MTVIAIAKMGQEFMYKTSTSHSVNEKKADLIIKALNNIRYKLQPGEVWHKYNVSKWENAGVYGETQKFTLGKTGLKEYRY